MVRAFVITAVLTAFIALLAAAFAQQPGQFGNADDAKAMLTKAIAAVKADKVKALEMFNKGEEGGFRDRDIYPFCINFSDGIQVATQVTQTRGVDARTLTDSTGRHFGQELYDKMAKAKDGEIVEHSFMFPRPGGTTPVQKVAFVMRAGDLYCGVGYYK
jgi:hypothetical protein